MIKKSEKRFGLDLLKFKDARFYKIIILLASIFGAIFFINQSRYLRSLGYEVIPDVHDADEYNYVWQAISLRKYGLPVAWTEFNGVYSNSKYQPEKGNLDGLGVSVEGKIVKLQDFKKNSRPVTAVTKIDWSKGLEYMTFVMPFFDHPPLGGLIYSLGVNRNTSRFDQVKPVDFRKPALVMAILTSILLFIFILQITGKPLVAALSSAIYSTVPTYILATRGAYLENITPPFILAHLVLLLISMHLIKKRHFVLTYTFMFLSGLLGGLGGLSKENAVGFLFGSLAIVLFYKVPFKYILTLIIGIAIPFLIYIGWGFWLQKDLFIGVILANSIRSDFGSLKFLTIFESLRFKDFPIDGWWVWGIISMFLVGYITKLKENKYIYLVAPMFCNLLAIVFMASPNYPWYWLSLIPFMAGASAIIMGNLFENPNFLILMVFLLVPFSSSFYWGYGVFHQNSIQSLNIYRGVFIVIFATYFIRKYLSSNKYGHYIWMAVFFIVLVEISKWNFHSIQYMVANWDKLPVPGLPTL